MWGGSRARGLVVHFSHSSFATIASTAANSLARRQLQQQWLSLHRNLLHDLVYFGAKQENTGS